MRDLPEQLETVERKLAGQQARFPVLSSKHLTRLCSGKEYSFISYSDNILESLHLLNTVAKLSDFLDLIGIVYEPIHQPVYSFRLHDHNRYLNIKVCGDYNNWTLPQTVGAVVNFIDRPDVILCDAQNQIQPALVVETTGTANVGNSQWQREGRKVGAARQHIPFVYQTYYSGTDRSQAVEGGQPREPTSLQVLNHLIYSLRYKVPSLALYFPNPPVDQRLGFDRVAASATKLLANYVSTILCTRVDRSYTTHKMNLETTLYQLMLDYITELVPKRRGKQVRLDKDLPVLTARQRDIFIAQQRNFLHFLVKWVNSETSEFDKRFDFTNWDLSRFKPWGRYYAAKPLIAELSAHLAHPVSYLSGTTKCAVCVHTQALLKVLDDQYNPDNLHLSNILHPERPTLIIATRIFKGARKIVSPDPESGELTAFSELFAYDAQGQKTMNVILYVHVAPPEGFDFSDFILRQSKLAKAIKHAADLVVLDDMCYEIRPAATTPA